MTALYIASLEKAAGKTALAAGLGYILQQRGKKVAYFKPLHPPAPEAAGPSRDPDTCLLKQVLALEEEEATLAPVAMTIPELESHMASQKEDFLDQIKRTYLPLAAGKDLVLMEGLPGFRPGTAERVAALKVMEALDARGIILTRYPLNMEAVTSAAKALEGRLAGIVVNAVPVGKRDEVEACLHEVGLPLLGLLPEERGLAGLTFDEMASRLGAEYLTSKDGAEELVESVMLGIMSPDPVLGHFQRRDHKVVVVRGDRPDIQLAALATSVRGLILTGGKKTLPAVLYRARELKVPVALVDKDTTSAVAEIEAALEEARFHQRGKLGLMVKLLSSAFDFPALYRALGWNG